MDTDNWRLTQGGEPTMDWRANLQPDLRERIANKITEILKRHLPFSGQEGAQELKKIAVRFEEKIYTAATSQSDYLRKISLKMLTMETKSQNTLLNSLQSNPVNNSKNPPDLDSQNVQSQVNNQGQPLPILVPTNRSVLPQNVHSNIPSTGMQGSASLTTVNNQGQPLPIPVPTNQSVLPQNVHSNILSTGMQGSASLTTGLPPVSSLSQGTMANVVVQNSNLQDIQNISEVSHNTLGNSMGQGVPSNIFANYQRQTQQCLSQQQLQRYLYQQQLQQQLMKQKFQQGNIKHSLMQSHLQHSVHMLPQSKVPVQQQTHQNAIDHQKQLFQSQIAIPAASSTSLDSIAQTGNASIGDWREEVYQKVMSQDSVNSYISCYCGDPAPIKMCWTDDNPGRRFVGCRNNAQLCGFFDWIDPQKTPREKMYEFYCKNQGLKSQNEQVKQMSEVVEERNLKLQQMNGLLEKSIEVEQQMKLEWKNKFVDLKKKYRKDAMKKKWAIVLLLTLLIFSWFNRLY